jgi:hypothetical protein
MKDEASRAFMVALGDAARVSQRREARFTAVGVAAPCATHVPRGRSPTAS